MSNARNMARLLADSSGSIVKASFPPVPASRATGVMTNNYLPSGSILQVQSVINTGYSSATVDLSYWTDVAGMSVTINPIRSNSFFKIDVRWGGEVAGAWDVVFALKRNSTVIGQPSREGTRMGAVGMPLQTYIDDDNNSTLEYSCFSYIDQPMLSSSITYKLISQAWSSRTLYTGSVVAVGTDAANYERISTEIIVTEIAA